MRSKILATVLAISTVVSPTAAVAEPTYEVKIAENEFKVAEAIKETINPYSVPTKDEKAEEQIAKYVKKLAEEQKKAEAKRKAEAAKKAATKAAQEKAAAAKAAAARVANSNVSLPGSNACVVAMKKVFPEHLWKVGYAIMMAESSARPNAIGGPNYNGTYDYGCWQINNSPRALDPMEGTKIAWYKYNHSGWYPWVAWKNGKHLRFM